MDRALTHLAIDQSLFGTPTLLEPGRSEVRLVMTRHMTVDDRGLVHGGFVFGLADYAAMLAVNHPNVVLGSADVRFSAPVRVGEELTAVAVAGDQLDDRREVEVVVRRAGETVLSGTFTCHVLDRHVLDR
jgi:acyl-coenzyme A thioesterase PaaI-like protein